VVVAVDHVSALDLYDDLDNIEAFEVCVPLYRLANFLGLDSL